MMRIFVLSAAAVLFAALLPEARAAGGGIAARAVAETVETAAKRSGRILDAGMKKTLEKRLFGLAARYGDDVLPAVRRGGLEAMEEGAKHGEGFWKLCRRNPKAARLLALRADELLPLVRRIGDEALEVELRAPGSAALIAREFGDAAVRHLAKAPRSDIVKLLGYAARADSPATKRLLFRSYRNARRPPRFLEALDWKRIMATGLSAAAITAAYKTSDGLQQGLRDPRAAEAVAVRAATLLVGTFCGIVVILLLPLLCRRIVRAFSAAASEGGDRETREDEGVRRTGDAPEKEE